MRRVLLLCFVHGFKGDDITFRKFPDDLKSAVSADLPDHQVEAVIYPRYETKGELEKSTETFLEWLKEQVMNIRKVHLEKPWPPSDRNVGVILVAHSMGGFVASDALFRILDERRASGDESGPLFPLIQGILAFDTPYNGLARSMFVYGAFSNYQKVSSVFNVMTALSAAAPATISSLVTKRGASNLAKSSIKSSSPAWKTWQLVAVRTGTIGAIAAGGVAAYTHRKQIIEGVRSVRNLNKDSIAQGYHQSMDAIGNGLAYINRGNVGKSFAWLSDHLTFVGALMKPTELNRRLQRLAALKGVGVHDIYASMGENGYWSGGYFVPERTFCAVPEKDEPAHSLFARHVLQEAEDEVEAHLQLFQPEKNQNYDRMTQEASTMVIKWFNTDEELFDDPKFSTPPPSEKEEAAAVDEAMKDAEKPQTEADEPDSQADETDAAAANKEGKEVPDESPIDIAAAASLVPLPDDDPDAPLETKAGDADDDKKTYMQHLFQVAQQAGTGVKDWWPNKMPTVSKEQMPSLPKVSMPNVTMPSVTLPHMGMFSKKSSSEGEKPATAESADADKSATPAENVISAEKEIPAEKGASAEEAAPAATEAPAEKETSAEKEMGAEKEDSAEKATAAAEKKTELTT